MTILATMGERESRRVAKAVGRAMDHLRHHRQRLHGAGADAGRQQQVREIDRAAFGGGSQGAVQAAGEHVARAHIMMRRHDQMRQLRLRPAACREQSRVFPGDAVRPQGIEKFELG